MVKIRSKEKVGKPDCWLDCYSYQVIIPALFTSKTEHTDFFYRLSEKREEVDLLLSLEEPHTGPAFEMLVPGHHGQIVLFSCRKDEPVCNTAFEFGP